MHSYHLAIDPPVLGRRYCSPRFPDSETSCWLFDLPTCCLTPLLLAHGIQGQILKRTLGLGPAIVILSLCVVALCLQATAQLQASSRFVWALARDQAIPFSKYFYALNKHRLPVAATWLVLAMALPMAAVIWTAPHITASVLSTAAGTFCMVSYVSLEAMT